MELLFRIGVFSLEPLADFLKNKLHVTTIKFENIWVGHRDKDKLEELVVAGELATPPSSFSTKRPFVKPPFDMNQTIDDIYTDFKFKTVISYLLTDCYILYKANDSWESVIDCDMNEKLRRLQATDARKRKGANLETGRPSKKSRPSSPDLFSSDELKAHKNQLPGLLKWPAKRDAVVSCEQGESGNAVNVLWRTENISLDPILYSQQQQIQVFPENFSTVVQMITKALAGNSSTKLSYWEKAIAQCTNLSQIMQQFVDNGAKISHKSGLRRIFQRHLKCRDRCEFIKKETVSSYICDVIRRVISPDFFSSNRQKKNFLQAICRLITIDRFQRVALEKFISIFKKELPQWCKQVPPASQQHLLVAVLKFLINDFILVTLKSIFYVTECGSTGFELYYFVKSHMESKVDRQINVLKLEGKIEDIKEDESCLEKKWMNGDLPCSSSVGVVAIGTEDLLPDNRMYQLPACKLRFMPKAPESAECRLITIRPATTQVQVDSPVLQQRSELRSEYLKVVKHFLDCGISSIGTGTVPLPSSPTLFTSWEKAVNLNKSGKVFYAKGDIVDAYGSVGHKKLMDILDLFLKHEKNWKLITIKEWGMARGKLTLFSRVSFSRKTKNKRLLHSREYGPGPKLGYSTVQLKAVISQVISNQVVIHGSRRFRVKKGLCQGGAGLLSNKLCDMYYTAMDQIFFGSLTNQSQDCVLVRAVDDYLFISTNREKVQIMLRFFSQGIEEFNVKFAKIKSNVIDNTLSTTNFLGLQFNFNEVSVQPSYKFKCPQDIVHQMKLNNCNMDPSYSQEYFLRSRLMNINSMKLLPIVTDERWCDGKRAVVVLNEACRIQAYKAVAVAILLRPNLTDQLLTLVLKKCVKRIARKIKQLDSRQVNYIFWQNMLVSFLRHNSRFFNFIKTVKSKIILFYSKMKFSTQYVTHSPDWWAPENEKKLANANVIVKHCSK